MTTTLVHREQLVFTDSRGLVRTVTKYPGGRSFTKFGGLSGCAHNHQMLADYDSSERRPFPFVCEANGVVREPGYDEMAEMLCREFGGAA